ncbi:MAG: amino acid--tRNA ligase-related protein [Candidatus Shapirobacteria bacterium]|jgi:elongation factor P--beta-lysine ligase
MEIKSQINNFKNHQIFLETKKLAGIFLKKAGFIEIDTPLLSPSLIPESYLEIFETKNLFKKNNQEMYLIPSPELFLKRLIVDGIGNCFSLGKSFRNNEPVEIKHSFEFTMLEFYRVNADYFEITEDVMNLLRFISKKMFGKEKINYQNKIIDLKKFEKITVTEAFKKYAGITDIFDHKKFFEQAKNKGYRVENMDYIDVWSQIYGIEVEPNLGKNGMITFIYEYPKELAAITKINEFGIAERFEFYIGGIELGNCGNEGVEIEEYKKRFNDDAELVSYKTDDKFIEILEKLPKCAGIAIGVDRLAMIFADVKNINDLKLIIIE